MEPYKHNMGVFLAKDQVRIFYQSWQVKNPKLIILISHGIGEHSGRYSNLMDTLEKKGISFYALDHRGSGKSGGRRGHVDSFAKFHEDIKYLVDNVIKKENKNIPIIMIGHSLGGLIAEMYALNYPKDLKGLILSAPALINVIPIPAWKKVMAKVLANLIPTLTLGNEIDPNFLCSDSEVVKAYLDDPLTHDRVSAKFYIELLNTTEEAINRANELAMPLLVIHGTGDKIVSIKSSEHIHTEAKSKDKKIATFEGLFHETMNEKVAERKKVLKLLSDWILAHMK